MNDVLCTMYHVLGTMYYVQCTMYNVLCTMYDVLCMTYNVCLLFMIYNLIVPYIRYAYDDERHTKYDIYALCTTFNIRYICTMYDVRCAMYIVRHTIYDNRIFTATV